jgi:hypothetical protein
MNETPLRTLLDRLVPDPWREEIPFETEFAKANDDLLGASCHRARAKLLGAWLARHQPCIFGGTQAREGRIVYCFLTENDLLAGEDHVIGTIAARRFRWRSRALRGETSAFVILALSPLLARAEPNDDLFALAQKLVESYLMKEVPADLIRHDDLVLRTPAGNRGWRVGVNFFGAQGDGRWWQDHRIPGGIALSMNSVGHWAYAQRLKRGELTEDQRYGLDAALTLAMKLINGTKPGMDKSAPGPNGRNTWLHSVADRPEPPGISCPVPLPKALAEYNRCQYAGLYHTDQTLPRCYFNPASCRPPGPPIDDLDLTYLHHDAPDNPDYRTMGLGVPE